MKFIIAFSCLLVLAFANEDANVLQHDSEVNVENFSYNLKLDNGVATNQQGSLKDKDTWSVKGDYSFKSPEGENVAIQYLADENGYQVLSAVPPLPTSPPIPEAILRAIDYINAHPSTEK